jgi:hypothetical protein
LIIIFNTLEHISDDFGTELEEQEEEEEDEDLASVEEDEDESSMPPRTSTKKKVSSAKKKPLGSATGEDLSKRRNVNVWKQAI